MPAAHPRDEVPALPGARGPPACLFRSQPTNCARRGGALVLGLPGAGSLPVASPSPPCGAPGPAAPKPAGRAGLGAGTTKTSRGDPSGPQEDLRMRQPRPPAFPGSGARGSSLKRRLASQVAMLPGGPGLPPGPGLQQEGPQGLSPACRAWRGWRLGRARTGCGHTSLGIAARPSHPGHAANCARPVWALGPQPQVEALESSRLRHARQRSLHARRPIHTPPPVTWLGV